MTERQRLIEEKRNLLAAKRSLGPNKNIQFAVCCSVIV